MKQRMIQFPDYISNVYPELHMPRDDKKKVLSRTVTFQVTDACNLCCTYCYQTNKGNHVMSFDVAKKFIDMLLDSTEENNEYINPIISPAIVIEFIGGEPLLEIDLIDKISNYFINQMIIKNHPWLDKHMFSICSNGVLYNDPRVQKYLRKHREQLSFSISIDGNKKLHDSCRIFPDGSGSYDIAIAAVHHYVEELHGVMGSKMTLCPQNIKYTYEAVLNLIKEGYSEIFLNCVYEEGWVASDATILYYQLKKVADYITDNDLFQDTFLSIFDQNLGYTKDVNDLDNWCGGTGTMIAVDYKGDIYPCIRYMESSLGTEVAPLVIGNVQDGLMKTKKQKDCVNCLECINRKTQSTEECFNCPIGTGCSWCSAFNYQTFGTADKRATYICVMHRARVLANVYFYNRVFEKLGESKVFQNNVPDEWALEIINAEELEMLKKLEMRLYHDN